MKRRMTEILSNETIGSGGQTFTKDLPSDFVATALAITQEGANVTDEATLAEVLAGFGTIELATKNGTPHKWDADDLFYFMQNVLGWQPYVSKTAGTGSDNDIRYATLVLPLNPKGIWDPSMGMSPTSKGKIRVVAGSDTVAGMDARTLTITALGVQGINPASYMGAYLDSFTAKLGDNFQDIQMDRVKALLGAHLFMTTGIEDLTSTNAPGTQYLGWAVSKSVKEKVKAQVLQVLQNTECQVASGIAAPVSDYVTLDLGLKVGQGLPYVNDLQVYIDAGVAEAHRLYPLLEILN